MGRSIDRATRPQGDAPQLAPGLPRPPEPPRPLKYLWAASVTGALLAELAATSTGPAADFLRAVLVSAGVPVRVPHVLPPSGVDGPCSCGPSGVEPAAGEGGSSSCAPADQSIPRPAGRP